MNWLVDVRYAARRLVSRPAYSVLAVLTLALGVGGTAAVFGIARPLIVDELPYANARTTGTFWMPGWWTEEEFLYMRDKFTGFAAVGAYRPGDVTLRNGDAPARLVPGVQVTAELFDVIGARPILGRSFRKGDDAQGSAPAAMISYGLYQELGGTPDIVGKQMTLNGASQTIVGVMPKRFWFPSPDVRIWTMKPLDPEGRNGSYALVGLAGRGFDIRRMNAPLAQITRTLGERFHYSPQADKTQNAKVTPLRDELLGSMRPAVIATFASMSLILLIACANVAALMLGQVEGRATELAVRAALGATRARITQQLVIEALWLGIGAALLGGVFAAIGFRLLAHSLPIGAWAESVSFDWSMFIAALVIALAAVLLVVIVPASALWRADLRDSLNRARTGGIQGRGGRLERGLVVVEVALAMLIATGAGLLVRSVSNRYAIDAGINPAGVGVIDVSAGPELRSRERRLAVEAVVRELAQLPGVKSAAAAMKLPLRGGGDSFDITVPGFADNVERFTYFRIGTLGYLETMGYHLRSGRLFTTADAADTAHVNVIINEALAKKYFAGVNPIGRTIGGGFNAQQTIIGIVADAAEADLTTEGEPARYYLSSTVPWFSAPAAFVVRTQRPEDAARILESARRTIQRAAPGFGIQDVTTMQRVFDNAVGPVRQIMALLALLSGLALMLGAVGIYGVISHFASRRKRDWAIRVALGLPGSGVVRHVVTEGLALALVGVVVGAIVAGVFSRILSTFLYGVSAIDPLSFIVASGLLLVIGGAAAFFPARRAGTVDPALVLREQ
jgi:putative ABC transport system permease protein